MKKIEVSESALESLKAMAQKLQEERDMLLAALKDSHEHIGGGTGIKFGMRWKEMYINNEKAIAACQESTKVME